MDPTFEHDDEPVERKDDDDGPELEPLRCQEHHDALPCCHSSPTQLDHSHRDAFGRRGRKHATEPERDQRDAQCEGRRRHRRGPPKKSELVSDQEVSDGDGYESGDGPSCVGVSEDVDGIGDSAGRRGGRVDEQHPRCSDQNDFPTRPSCRAVATPQRGARSRAVGQISHLAATKLVSGVRTSWLGDAQGIRIGTMWNTLRKWARPGDP